MFIYLFYSTDNLVTSLQGPSGVSGEGSVGETESAHVDIAFRQALLKVNRLPGVGEKGYYANLIAATSGCHPLLAFVFPVFSTPLFVISSYRRCLGGC